MAEFTTISTMDKMQLLMEKLILRCDPRAPNAALNTETRYSLTPSRYGERLPYGK